MLAGLYLWVGLLAGLHVQCGALGGLPCQVGLLAVLWSGKAISWALQLSLVSAPQLFLVRWPQAVLCGQMGPQAIP